MQHVRLLLLPFAWIYGIITYCRNLLFDLGIRQSYSIPKKSICIGNLSVGGTGKTPHVAYLTSLLKDTQKITILSRGYGRKTKGFILGSITSSDTEIGDEPKLYISRFFPQINVVVCEKRVEGVQKIQALFPENNLIILDDAFQHRAVKAGLNILLTDFSALFSNDFVLPAGNLREWKSGKKRADYVIVTKCPQNISETDKLRVIKSLRFNKEKIFFSAIIYGDLIPFGKPINTDLNNVLLVTGIANFKPLLLELQKRYTVETISFPDHHIFSIQDIERIHQKFDTFATGSNAIVTTEKDYMRLSEMTDNTNIKEYPWLYQTIEVEIDNKYIFNKLIMQYVNSI